MSLEPMIVEMLLDAIARGEPMTRVAEELGITMQSVYRHRDSDADPTFTERYNKAREDGHDAIAANTMRISRGEVGYSSGDPKRDRLIVDTDLKLLAAWDRRYSVKTHQTVDATVRQATVTMPPEGVSDQDAAAFYQGFMKGG